MLAEQPEANSQEETAGGFDPSKLDRAIISLPLQAEIDRREAAGDTSGIWVIIDTNHLYPEGRTLAIKRIKQLIAEIAGRPEALDEAKNKYSGQYVFACLRATEIRELARKSLAESEYKESDAPGVTASQERAVYKIWLDHEVDCLTWKSASTVKADAARNAFGAFGKDIVWAVLDTGIDGLHPHFRDEHGKPATLALAPPLRHRDFTQIDAEVDNVEAAEASERRALTDPKGHGTHVAGIIAGRYSASKPGGIVVRTKRFNEDGKQGEEVDTSVKLMQGMAPQARLLSLKVLNEAGKGRASNLIAALEYIQDLNANGRNLVVHGVNMSVGYSFEPEWFACGQSPLCVEVNRLVRSGVVVVVAAGNTGYGFNQTLFQGPRAAGLDITINDPGNAELAITVGSTHRDMPHVYGVSFFSSKGPTGDGRLKPDIVAPGEKIVSCQCARGRETAEAKPGVPATALGKEAYYVEESGTSMAAPHVSGVIASFLSIRREFIGEPLRVKQIFLDSATDLNRAVYFQGRGLVDLMRAIQSV